MASFNSEFKKILKNLENNIEDKKALEVAKVEMFNLYNLFFDEITNLEQTLNNKILAIAESQLHVEEEIRDLNKSLKNIEKDIYMDEDFEDEDYEIEIKCPYCDKTFIANEDDLAEDEIVCPECNNTIELDWGHECSCGHDCDCGDDCDCDDDCDCGCDCGEDCDCDDECDCGCNCHDDE